MILLQQGIEAGIAIGQLCKVELGGCFGTAVGIGDGDGIIEIAVDILTTEDDILDVMLLYLLKEGAVWDFFDILVSIVGTCKVLEKVPAHQNNGDNQYRADD